MSKRDEEDQAGRDEADDLWDDVNLDEDEDEEDEVDERVGDLEDDEEPI